MELCILKFKLNAITYENVITFPRFREHFERCEKLYRLYSGMVTTKEVIFNRGLKTECEKFVLSRERC